MHLLAIIESLNVIFCTQKKENRSVDINKMVTYKALFPLKCSKALNSNRIKNDLLQEVNAIKKM